jgi:hypothetical protein
VYRALREAYRPLFSKIVYTGFEERPPTLPASEAFVTCQGERGSLQYACFANVMQVGFPQRFAAPYISGIQDMLDPHPKPSLGPEEKLLQAGNLPVLGADEKGCFRPTIDI